MYSVPFNFLNEQQTWSQRRIRKQPNKINPNKKTINSPPPKKKKNNNNQLQPKNQLPQKNLAKPKIKTQPRKNTSSAPTKKKMGSNYQQLPFDSHDIDSS